VNQLPILEERMDDVRAVLEAVRSDRAALFGHSEGGNMCVLFAATYPERTAALITLGSFAKRLDPDEDYPWAPTAEARKATVEDVERSAAFYATHLAPAHGPFPYPRDLFLKFVAENEGSALDRGRQ